MQKNSLSPGGMVAAGLMMTGGGAGTWFFRGSPNLLDFWLIGVGTILFLAGVIVAAAKS